MAKKVDFSKLSPRAQEFFRNKAAAKKSKAKAGKAKGGKAKGGKGGGGGS